MNTPNALGFLAVGSAMWLLPVVAPGLFPHTAIDGSSTRALWSEVMGLVQTLLALAYLVRCYAQARQLPPPALADRGMISGSDWEDRALPAMAAAINFGEPPIALVASAVAAEPAASVTLHGEHAVLWRAFHAALCGDGHVRQLAERVVRLASAGDTSEPDDADLADPAYSGLVRFAWDDPTEVAEEQAA